MLHLVIAFLVITLAAAVLVFSGLVAVAAGIAKIIFYIASYCSSSCSLPDLPGAGSAGRRRKAKAHDRLPRLAAAAGRSCIAAPKRENPGPAIVQIRA